MPRYLTLLAILLSSYCAFSQNNTVDTTRMFIAPNGDTLKQYFFVMLKAGAKRDLIKDTAQINKIQAGHMANITRLHAAGKLLVAGPFGDDGNWRGIFIFDCQTKEEVEALLITDPAIKSGRLDYEVHPWWTKKGAVIK